MYGYFILWKFGKHCNNSRRPVYRSAEKAVKVFEQDIMEEIENICQHGGYVYVDVFPELQMVKITEKYSSEAIERALEEGNTSCCMLCKTLIEPGMPLANEEDEEDETD